MNLIQLHGIGERWFSAKHKTLIHTIIEPIKKIEILQDEAKAFYNWEKFYIGDIWTELHLDWGLEMLHPKVYSSSYRLLSKTF